MKLDRFINRPVLSTVISVLIVILGIIGLATLPVTQYPDIAPPTVQVRATYTGANSTAVLQSVMFLRATPDSIAAFATAMETSVIKRGSTGFGMK